MKQNIEDFKKNNLNVLLRCDYNVPIKDGKILDDTRIVESLKTIEYLLKLNSKVIIISHLGKVKEKKDLQKNSLYPVAQKLSILLKRNIYFIKDTNFTNIKKNIDNINNGNVILLENTRFYDLDGKLESNCDDKLAKNYSTLADVFINDAFGTLHRKHASNVGVSKYLDSYIGYLVMNELDKLSILKEDIYPYTIIMGGAKIADKINVIDKLITKCTNLVIGGIMANTFIKAKGYNIGNSLYETDKISYANSLLDKYNSKIVLPVDFKTSTSLDSSMFINKKIDELALNDMALDLGFDSINNIKNVIKDSKLIFWNGPLGYYENDIYKQASLEIIRFILDNNIKLIVGGGDIVACLKDYKDKIYHVSTGGGATLDYLACDELVGLINIKNKE